MKVRYFADTDTLSIELRPAEIADTRDLDASRLVEFDEAGNLCAITAEHARERANLPGFSFEQVSGHGAAA